MIRKRTLIAVLLAVTMTISGCSALTGDGATYVASQAGVSDAAVEETGFELERSEWQNRSRTIDFAGQERTINVSTYVQAYVWGENRGAFAVLSSPEISTAGQAMNPLADMSNKEMIKRLEDGFEQQGDLQNLQRQRNYTVTAAGEERSVTEFSATAVSDDTETDVVIHVLKFTDGGDIVIAAGVHPESADEVRTDVESMMGNVDH